MSSDPSSEQKVNIGHRWKKGQSGNPGGRPKKELSVSAILKVKLSEIYTDKTSKKTQTKAQWIADKLIFLALKGDMPAIREILNRVDGAPKQTAEVFGKDGGVLQVQVLAGNGYSISESGESKNASVGGAVAGSYAVQGLGVAQTSEEDDNGDQ